MSGVDDLLMEVTPQVLLKAYACGIFPMAESADDPGLFWVEPRLRGILPLDEFHLPRRLARTIRQGIYETRVDTSFVEVMEACASRRSNRDQTWINGRIKQLYTELFHMGHCHSVESWHNGELVGGLYGVRLGSAFFGESMFSTMRDASKVALAHLVERLKAGGFNLLDTQFNTEHLSQFGTREIPASDYEYLLEQALETQGDFFAIERA